MSESYRVVTVLWGRIAPSGKAFFVTHPRLGTALTIPRSLVHGADEVKALSLKRGEDWTFRLMEWKAEELKLA